MFGCFFRSFLDSCGLGIFLSKALPFQAGLLGSLAFSFCLTARFCSATLFLHNNGIARADQRGIGRCQLAARCVDSARVIQELLGIIQPAAIDLCARLQYECAGDDTKALACCRVARVIR